MANRFDTYLFRAHSVGNIMRGLPKPLTDKQQEIFDLYTERKNGNGKPLTDNQLALWGELYKKKNAKPSLTDGVKTYLEGLVYEEVTGRKQEIKSKYLDKGLICEENSLTAYSNYKDALVIKNKERKENDYFSGECDIARYKVRDIKTSWSYQTFPLREDEIPNKMYEWQLDVYMCLFGYKRSELIYCLVDTPNKLVDDELRRLDWQFNIFDATGEVREESKSLVIETVCNLIFTEKGLENYCSQSSSIHSTWFEGIFREIPEEMRVKIYKHNYDQKRIDLLITMVKLARDYMNKVYLGLGENILKLEKLKVA